MPAGRDPHTSAAQTGEVPANPPLGDAERALELLLAVQDGLRAWASAEPRHARLLGGLPLPLGYAAGALWLPRGDALFAHAFWSAPGVDGAALEGLLRPVPVARGREQPARAGWRCAAG